MDWQACWRARQHFTIFDSGSDFDDVLQAWRADPQRPARLHLISLARSALPGFRRIPQADAGVTLDLLDAPLDVALAQLDARLDAIVLHDLAGGGHGFARALARLSAPGARLHASGLSEAQVHAIGGAGFAVERDGSRIDAVFTSRKPPSPWARQRQSERRAIVVGAGLAGSAVCEKLCARGWQVTLVERHAAPACEASGNWAGISMPLVSKDDNIMTRLVRAAFLYAQADWRRFDGILGARCGVVQLARDAAHAEVQRAIAHQHGYPASYAQWLEPAAASAQAGVPAPHGAWLFPHAGWARPASVCAAMLDACGPRLERRFGAGSVALTQAGGEWTVTTADGSIVARAPVVVMANGAGALQLAQTATLPLASVRGQVTHVAEGVVPALERVLCREAYLIPLVEGMHSLGASYDDDADPALRASSQDENLAKIASLLGGAPLAQDLPLAGRVGFRCVAPDRLPLVGALPEPDPGGRIERLRDVARQPGLYGVLGYASRGLSWAPLAAELLAAQLDGEPLPLEAELVAALDPARFVLRAKRRPA